MDALRSSAAWEAPAAAPPSCDAHAPVWGRSLARFLPSLFEAVAAHGVVDAANRTTLFEVSAFAAAVAAATAPGVPPPENHGSILTAVSGGVPYIFAPGGTTVYLHDWVDNMLRGLHAAAEAHALPDAFFLLTTGDWPQAPRSAPPPRVPILSDNTDDSSWDVPVPGGQFDEAYGHGRRPRLAAGAAARPWSTRDPRAVWRGTLMCASWFLCTTRCPRIAVRRAAARRPDLLDVRFSHTRSNLPHNCSVVATGGLLAEDASAPDRALSRAAQQGYRFSIATDGHSYASGLKYALHYGGVTLRQRSGFAEFFDPALEPWVQHGAV